MTGSVLVEACVTTVEEAVACAAAGAHRLELCRDLEHGGLTPGVELLSRVLEAVDVPVFAMARPRQGSFVFDSREVTETLNQVEVLIGAGAQGIVLGLVTSGGQVDQRPLEKLVRAAGGLPVTFHRAFDELPDAEQAMESLAGLGVTRVLTSGGGARARDGMEVLTALAARSDLGVEVLAGGGVRGDHVAELVERTGVREVHARAEGIAGVMEALAG